MPREVSPLKGYMYRLRSLSELLCSRLPRLCSFEESLFLLIIVYNGVFVAYLTVKLRYLTLVRVKLLLQSVNLFRGIAVRLFGTVDFILQILYFLLILFFFASAAAILFSKSALESAAEAGKNDAQKTNIADSKRLKALLRPFLVIRDHAPLLFQVFSHRNKTSETSCKQSYCNKYEKYLPPVPAERYERKAD